MERKLKDNPEQFLNIYSREAKVLDINKEERTAELVVATEQPVVVFDWAKWEPIREIVLVAGLRHSDSVIMLDTHSRWSTNDIKGSVKDIKLQKDYEKLGDVKIGVAHFSKTAEKEWTLRQEGHLTDSSIGYRVNESETVVIPAGQAQKVQGKEYKNDFADGLPLVIRTGTDLLEISLVPIGADQAAKFRSMFMPDTSIPASKDADSASLTKEEVRSIIKEEMTEHENKIQLNKKGDIKMNEEQKLAEEQRLASIDALAVKYADKVKGIKEVAEAYKAGGRSFEEFGKFVTDKIVESHREAVAKPLVDPNTKEMKNYSVGNLLRSLVFGGNCAEREISDQIGKDMGKRAAGIYLPHNAPINKRDLLAGTATAAAELVGTDHLGSQFIDYLYNKMVFGQAGVTYLTGLQGNVEIPKLSASAAYGWAATEAAQISEGAPTTTEVELSPKRGGVYVEISRQLLIQGNPSAERVFTNDLLKSLALGADLAIAHGTGASGQPQGIVGTTGVGSFNGASFNRDAALEALSDVMTANADAATMYFVTRPAHMATLMGRKIDEGSGLFLVNDARNMIGYPVLATNQITDQYVLFGDFSQVLVGFWGAVDLLVNPYIKDDYGLVRITAQQLMDVDVRQPGALTYCSNFS